MMKFCIQIEAYKNRELNDHQSTGFEEHLDTCPSCALDLKKWDKLQQQVLEIVSAEESHIRQVNGEFAEHLVATAKHRTPKNAGSFPVLRVGIAASAAAVLLLGFFLFFSSSAMKAPAQEVTHSPISVLRFDSTQSEPSRISSHKGDSITAPSSGRAIVNVGQDRIGIDSGGAIDVVDSLALSTTIKIKKGAIAFAVHKRKNEARFSVLSGVFQVRVVGTSFLVHKLNDDAVKVVVVEGEVLVIGPSGKIWQVESGHTLRAIGDEVKITRHAGDQNINRIGKLLTDTVPKPQDMDTLVPIDASPEGDTIDTDEKSIPTIKSNAHPKPHSAKENVAMWRKWIVDGKISEANRALLGHVKKNPSDYTAWGLLADCRRKSGDWKGAVTAYTKIAASGPPASASRASYRAGTLLQDKLGDHRGAADMFKRYLRSEKGGVNLTAEATIRLAKSLISLGQKQEARNYLNKVVTIHGGTQSADRARRMLEEME